MTPKFYYGDSEWELNPCQWLIDIWFDLSLVFAVLATAMKKEIKIKVMPNPQFVD